MGLTGSVICLVVVSNSSNGGGSRHCIGCLSARDPTSKVTAPNAYEDAGILSFTSVVYDGPTGEISSVPSSRSLGKAIVAPVASRLFIGDYASFIYVHCPMAASSVEIVKRGT